MTLALSTPNDINRRGIQAMIASQACYSLSDTMVKLVTTALPPGEIMAIRGCFGTVILFALVKYTGDARSWRGMAQPIVLLRGVLEGVISLLFIVSIGLLPIGNYTAIMLSAPLIITLLAVVFLRVHVGIRRWSAIGLGFVGVIMVAKPSAGGFPPAAIYAVICAFLVAVRDLITRNVPNHVPSMVVTLTTSLLTTLAGFGMMTTQANIMPSNLVVLMLLVGACGVTFGNLLVIIACRKADVSTVTPFRYAVMPFALMTGYFVWGNVPDWLAALGIVLIVGSGIYAFHRERMRSAIATSPKPMHDAV